MYISDFGLYSLELIASTDHVIEEIPHLSFKKIFAESLSVLYLVFKYEGVAFIC